MTVAAAVLVYRSYYGTDKGTVSYMGRLRAALQNYSNALMMGSEISSLLLSDLQTFLASDTQELPQSLKQLLRLAESKVWPSSCDRYQLMFAFFLCGRC
jgi:hypothetical protein